MTGLAVSFECRNNNILLPNDVTHVSACFFAPIPLVPFRSTSLPNSCSQLWGELEGHGIPLGDVQKLLECVQSNFNMIKTKRLIFLTFLDIDVIV